MLNAIMTVYKCECASLHELTQEDSLLYNDRLFLECDKFFSLYLNHKCYHCTDDDNDYFDIQFIIERQKKARQNKCYM